MMSIWHDDKVFPEDKRYWLAFINVRSNGNKFWKVSHYLADFIEDVSGAGFKVCNTKIEKWCYLDDLFAQQAEIDRLREALDDILRDTPSCFNNSCPLKHTEEDCQHYEICFVKKAYKALNSESEGK